MNKRSVHVREAAGKVLCHNVSGTAKGECGGQRFRKGYIIREEDIEELQLLGQDYVLIIEMDNNEVHEDDAAIRLARAAAGPGIRLTAPVESKVNLITKHQGLLKINLSLLEQLNGLQDIVMATLPANSVVTEGEKAAGIKVVPLVVQEKVIIEAETLMEAETPLDGSAPF